MSKVKRFRFVDMNGYPAIMICDSVKAERFVEEQDFDRVTAERDAALGRVAELKSAFDDLAASVGFSESRLDQTGDSPIDCANQLQQRLTAADERADMLEGLVGEVLDAVGREPLDLDAVLRLRARMRDALKPACGEQGCSACGSPANDWGCNQCKPF